MKKKDRTGESAFWKFVFPIILVFIGVITFFAVPVVNAMFLKLASGGKGLLYLLAFGGVLFLYYYMIYRQEWKTLRYILAVILFTVFCIWALANKDAIFYFLESNLGSWGMSGVLLIFCLVFYIVMRRLFR